MEDFDALKEQKARILQAQEEREFQKAVAAAGGIDAFLRAHGYDPDEVAARFRETARKALAEMETRHRETLEIVDRIAERLGIAFSIETRDEIATRLDAFAAARAAEAVAAERARIVAGIEALRTESRGGIMNDYFADEVNGTVDEAIAIAKGGDA